MNLQIINGCAGTDLGLPTAGTDPGGCYGFVTPSRLGCPPPSWPILSAPLPISIIYSLIIVKCGAAFASN